MRLTRFIVLIGVALLTIGQSLLAQSRQERKEQTEKKIMEMIDKNRLNINVDRAVPTAGRSVNLTSSYSLQIQGDSILASLPYFGRAYSAPYGGSGGIQFKEVVSEKSVSPLKKGGGLIKFRVKTKDDTYSFQVSVYTNGASTIHVQPVNKQSISYYGNVDLDVK